jgi:ankyrin repeat protein
MEKQAHSPYVHEKDNDDVGDVKLEDGEDYNPFVKPKDPRKVGKYSPLHWASYKNHYKIVCKFLNKKMSPTDIDMYGNTAVHQCAAAGNIKVLETFLAKGVDVEIKNARLHSPLDLATEPATKALIKKAINTKLC